MYPFKETTWMLVRSIPYIIQHPLFWAMTVFVFLQYARLSELETRLYGMRRHNPFVSTAVALVFGSGVGFFAGLVTLFIGPVMNDIGILYVWPVALILMLISPRFLCFAYAGGLLALASLIFGVPRIGVAQLLALVGILHLAESILIWIDGYYAAVPGFFRLQKGRHTGGYVLQRYWIVPLAVLFAVQIGASEAAASGIQMPDWWPLIRGGVEQYNAPGYVLSLQLLPAVLGYSDFSFARMPHKKVQITSSASLVYSITLIGLAILADRVGFVAYIAAIFAPLGHELVIYVGHKVEERPGGLFSLPEQGVRVLSVIPESKPFEAGVRPGDILLSVNGTSVSSVSSVRSASASGLGILDLELLSLREGACTDPSPLKVRLAQGDRQAGSSILLLPTPDEAPYIPVSSGGGLGSLVKRISRIFASRR